MVVSKIFFLKKLHFTFGNLENSYYFCRNENDMDIQIFRNEHFGEVRVAEMNGEPMFLLVDVCKALDIANSRDLRSRLREKGVALGYTPTNGGMQSMTYIDEGNLYKCIFRSRKDEAEKFQDWVCDEILPAVRKNGAYVIAREEDTEEELIARALIAAKAAIARKEARILELEEKRKIDAPKVEFFDEIVDSRDAIDVGRVAKVLNMGIGRNKLFSILREQGVLMDNNTPYQSYVDRGWMRCIETKYSKGYGDNCVYIKTVVFQKGVDGIRQLVKKYLKLNSK